MNDERKKMSDFDRLDQAGELIKQAGKMLAKAQRLVDGGVYEHCTAETTRRRSIEAIQAGLLQVNRVDHKAMAATLKYVRDRLGNEPGGPVADKLGDADFEELMTADTYQG